MRQTQLLLPTMKEDPTDADVISHKLMLRAGIVRQLASGLYTWLPLGLRVLRKIEAIIRQEMDATGAQEVLMPVVQPAELWQDSGRWEKMGPEMLRLTDRHDREFCLGPTHEEVITDLFRREIQSYKQLPVNYYQIQTKFRDERRPRFGVMRAREFTMKDGYSFHADQSSFDTTYQAMYQCYAQILTRMGLDFRAVEADTGNIGGAHSHEFHVLAESGEDTIVYASDGPYAANLEKAIAAPPPDREDAKQDLQTVDTPEQKSIAAVCELLAIEPQRTVKTLVVKGVDGPVALVLRGDHELNPIKAEKIPQIMHPLSFATEAEIVAATGVKPGSIGPVESKLPYLVDTVAASLNDFVCGANHDGKHLTGVNWGRDAALSADQIVDLRNVVEGDPAPDNQGELRFLRGIEVGHIFQLGTVYSEAMDASVLDQDGKNLTPMMGCYGMGVTRLVAAVVEQNHDANGITWPLPLAPFTLHIIALNFGKSEAVRNAAQTLYDQAISRGIEVLLDDRDERPGVKFAEADLIGIPHRIVVGDRGLKSNIVEYKQRRDSEATEVEVERVLDMIAG